MLRFLKGSVWLFLVSMLTSALASLADMLIPQVVRMTVDNILGGQPGNWPAYVMKGVNLAGGFAALRSRLWIPAAAIVAVALLRSVFQYVFRVSNTRASETFVKNMRDGLFAHIERLPYSWHMENHTGDIIQRCTSDIETIRNFVSEQLTAVFRIVVLIVMSMSFMVSMEPRLALVAAIPIPLILGNAIIFYGKIGKGFQECDENEGVLSTMAQENLTGVRVVRAFGREKSERDKFEAQNLHYTGLWEKLATTLSTFWSSQDILSGLQIMIVMVFGAVFTIRGRLTAGEYIAFISYNGMLTWPVRMLGRIISEMSKAGISADRLSYIMNSESEKDSAVLTPSMDGDIVFDDVSFSYVEGAEALSHISFEMKAGSTLGIMGGTGSGKSTLVLLLDKMYELPENCGKITVGGTDIRDIKTSHLRKNIGMVLQEPFLFSKTLAENISIASSDRSIEKVRQAAKDACLDETAEGFAKGYDTFVGERGVTLSGGQKQRAAIARALSLDTPIYIFDDSLSAVDTETDARIRASLEAKFGTAGIILISHRITTLSKADLIIVLDKGRIAEQGSPAELYEKGGIYRRVCDIQSGYVEREEEVSVDE